MKSNQIIKEKMIELAKAVSKDAVKYNSHSHHTPITKHKELVLSDNLNVGCKEGSIRPPTFYPVECHIDTKLLKDVKKATNLFYDVEAIV